jgi:hypothetical protein
VQDMIDLASGSDAAAPRPRSSTIVVAGLASLGAGAIHAAAIGVHNEHRPAVIAFSVLATLQLAWGAYALGHSSRATNALGALIAGGAVGGWVMAKTSGISFVAGLDVAESITVADGLAAGLAAVTLLLAARAVLAPAAGALAARPPRRQRVSIGVASLSVASLTMFGMVQAGNHSHAGGAGHSHGGATETAAHSHGATSGSPTTAGHSHSSATPVPYDPSKPIDLSGTPGVTQKQQADAENLVAVTLLRLPQYKDYKHAEAEGFRTINDGRTGVEHFVSEKYMSDDVILDPDKPESLVYDTTGGGRRLVAAMYMVAKGTPLEDVPNVGGKLMQWHTHENLCYNAQGHVAGLTNSKGECPKGLVKPIPTPMIHVWIESHPCGPFAALEGIGGGRIPDGEAKLCDHAHGAGS